MEVIATFKDKSTDMRAPSHLGVQEWKRWKIGIWEALRGGDEGFGGQLPLPPGTILLASGELNSPESPASFTF